MMCKSECLSGLSLNPDETEISQFDSKCQRDRLDAYFPVSVLGNLTSPALEIWVCNLIQMFPSQVMLSLSFGRVLFHPRDLRWIK